MKALKKVILFILCAILLTSSFACNQEGTPDYNDQVGKVEIPLSDDYLIKDGASSYTIVLPDEPRTYEKHAANELRDFVALASKVELQILPESQVTYSKDAKLLVLGETKMTAQNNVKADKSTYGARGYVIKKIDSNVFMIGGDMSGTLYAVYEFLHHQLGFEVYYADEIALEKGVKNNLLRAYDVSDIPDIPYVQGIGPYYRDKNIFDGHRMRFNVYKEIFINVTSQPWHNSFGYVSPTVYNNPDDPDNYHPKWFTSSDVQRGQLHYTAHGDEEELQALQDLIYQIMIDAIEKDFEKGNYYEYIGFMHQDSENYWASSDGEYLNEEKGDSVLALKEKYGSAYASAMLIQFVNPIAKRVQSYLDNHQTYKGRKMNITIFAYLDTEKAPVKVVDGKTVPIDDSVKLESNVSVLMAPIRADYIKDYEDSGMTAMFDEWSAIADQVSLWYYNYYFLNQFMYYDTTYSLQSFFKAAQDANASYIFNETPMDGNEKALAFGTLRTYLTSKLGWDVDADVNELIDNFFENYYKDASASMRGYFEELRTHTAMIKTTLSFSGLGSNPSSDLNKFWPEGVINGFMKYIEQAYADILPLKETDKALYEKLYDRITSDSLMPRYLLLRHYAQETYTDQTFIIAVKAFKEDCARLGIKGYNYLGDSVDGLVFSR